MKRIRSNIPQHGVVADPFGFGTLVRILRAGHPDADRSGYESKKAGATMELFLAMSSALRRIREAAEEEGLPAEEAPSLDDQNAIAAKDPEFGRYLGDWRRRSAFELMENAESFAASLVGGWSGGDLPEEDLPRNGAFDEALVRRVFFEQHGDGGAEDAFYIPALQEWNPETSVPGSYVFPDDPRFAEARKAIDAADVKVGKVKEDLTDEALRAAEEERGLMARLSDEEREALAERMTKAEAAIAKGLDEELSGLGLRRSPYAGTFIREAVAAWLIDEGGRIEKAFRQFMGLSPAQ